MRRLFLLVERRLGAMNEPTGRELNDKIADIREWLVRIDTKVDFLNEVKRTAEEADAKAEKVVGVSGTEPRGHRRTGNADTKKVRRITTRRISFDLIL